MTKITPGLAQRRNEIRLFFHREARGERKEIFKNSAPFAVFAV
jgi:hypothetical protein